MDAEFITQPFTGFQITYQFLYTILFPNTIVSLSQVQVILPEHRLFIIAQYSYFTILAAICSCLTDKVAYL